MAQFMSNLLTASIHGSIVILAVILLRLLLRKTPKKYICLLWLLAGIRLLMPIEIRSDLSLQPEFALPNWNLPALLPWVWGIIAICFGIYSLVSYMKLKAQVREAVRIRGGWECDKIDTAFILGFIRPRIYIPMGMNQQSQKHILEHERTHLDKGDHWIKMIGFLALALHWFNPLVWLAYILLCKDIEMACDERVVQFMELEERKSYSAALLSCSSRQMHFAASPVAFGEVSVKQRILSILNYKKPGFWISLLGVVAFFFVAVCLVTSPAEEVEPVIVEVPVMQTEAPTEAPTEETRAPSTFATNLKQEDIATVCTDAILRLKEQESYFLACEFSTVYPEREYSDYVSYSDVRRYGEDLLWLVYDTPEKDKCTVGSSVECGDMYGMHYGDYWVADGSRSDREDYDPNTWLDRYSPEGDVVSFPEGTGVTGQDSVSFHMAWTEEEFWGPVEMEGTFTYIFHDDGSLAEITCRYEELPDPEYPDEETYYHTAKLTVMTENPADTYDTIADCAGACVSQEQLEALRKEQNKTTEIPSNKTDYDRDYGLGSASMRWYFFDEEWQFAYGAENATNTGLTLTYFESGEGHKSLTAGEGFWLEELVDGRWAVLEPASPVTAPEEKIQVSWTGKDTLAIDWADSYGTLERGYYRIGRYYTAEMYDGRTETNHCYAKFRIYDANHDALLREAKAAVDNLLKADNYHLYSFNWMTQHDYEYYLSQEVWKNGKDYLQVTRYPSREDLSVMTNVRGSMWRDGKHYGLSWAEEPALSEVVDWNGCVDGYMDDTNFSMWAWDFEWYDAGVEEVYKKDNAIHIVSVYDYSDKYEASEITLTLDEAGNLKGMVDAYLPTRDCAQEEKVINVELVVFDTAKEEIASMIASQDIDTPIPFSWEEDTKNNPDAKKNGFRNNSRKKVETPADAIALADKESTMPPLMEFKTGYCQYKTYHDDSAGMWKVEMFWWQHDTMQTVYMTDDGITKMLVSVE